MERYETGEMGDENEALVKEICSRYILHWNYRGYRQIPVELNRHGSHVLELYYKENGLECIPDDLQLTELTNLYLHGNLLEYLPISLTKIKYLSVLEISRNRIRDLPDEIGNLINLVTLDLSNNLIEHLPDSIGQLTQLENLILIRNNLSSLPITIGHLKALVSLHLTGNQLKYLPEEISSCSSLIDLYVGYNVLKCLPQSITNLPRLAHLCASFNQLECLPLIPFISLPRIFFDFNPDINHLPFTFGCQQTVAICSAQRRQLTYAGNQQEDTTEAQPQWRFKTTGCFRKSPNNASIENYFNVKVESNNNNGGRGILTTKIKVDNNLKDIQTIDVTGNKIFGGKFECTTLREICMRAVYKMFFGQNLVICQRLGIDNNDIIYVRKQPLVTNFGRFILAENYLPSQLHFQDYQLKAKSQKIFKTSKISNNILNDKSKKQKRTSAKLFARNRRKVEKLKTLIHKRNRITLP